MTEHAVNVLVYDGSGVSVSSRQQTLAFLKLFLSHRYDVQLVSPKSLRQDPWMDNCALLVFPGGRDLPYVHDLQGEGTRRIRDWVRKGGKYLGLCAGAYFASGRVEFEVGTDLEVVGDRELAFFPGVCRGTTFPGFEYGTEKGSREVKLEINRAVVRDNWPSAPEEVTIWYNGGGAFILDREYEGVTPLARYGETEEKLVAGVFARVGDGAAVLWAVHPEHPSLTGDSNDAQKEADRIALMRSTLGSLGLEVAEAAAEVPPLSPLHLVSTNTRGSDDVAVAISAKFDAMADGMSFDVEDDNDSFHFDRNARSLTDDRTRSVVVCAELPRNLLFDLADYYRHWAAALPASLVLPFGQTLLYGEVVSSTQTLLEKNPKVLSALPDGLVCLASHQVAGRGRGGNSWISSAGCLQFSFVVRLPIKHSSKIVFLQYLAGLAAVQAVRTLDGYEDVPLRLKWPNDVYSNVGTEQEPVWKKIGGILVTSTFRDNLFTLIVGCGVNTNNPRPTLSVNQVIGLYNQRTGAGLRPIPQEQLLARIMAQMHEMWPAFLENGFEPFLDTYLKRWIHSNQRVTIKATGKVVKILGITTDHGMLQTIEVEDSSLGHSDMWGGRGGRTGAPKFVNLQPDGNGFDMLQNLLVSR